MLCNIRNSAKFLAKKNTPLVFSKKNFAIKSEKPYEEVRIPVPWGHIAGKWWGPQDKRPIFVLHGWQDNCGSFDRLIPLLPSHLSYLAVDFPGHGLSSQLPNGIFYHGIDAAIFIKRIHDYFAWSVISLLGHSVGGAMCLLYASLFPDKVEFLVNIDGFKPFSNLPGKGINKTIQNMQTFLRYDSLNVAGTLPPSYTYEELIEKFHLSGRKSVEKEYCKYILKRNTKESASEPGKYYFTRDSRVKVGPVLPMQHDDILEHVKRVTCPMLMLKATECGFVEESKYAYDVIDILKKKNNFEYNDVPGQHHVHLNNPERVAPFVTKFLEKYATGDRYGGGIKKEMIITEGT